MPSCVSLENCPDGNVRPAPTFVVSLENWASSSGDEPIQRMRAEIALIEGVTRPPRRRDDQPSCTNRRLVPCTVYSRIEHIRSSDPMLCRRVWIYLSVTPHELTDARLRHSN